MTAREPRDLEPLMSVDLHRPAGRRAVLDALRAQVMTRPALHDLPGQLKWMAHTETLRSSLHAAIQVLSPLPFELRGPLRDLQDMDGFLLSDYQRRVRLLLAAPFEAPWTTWLTLLLQKELLDVPSTERAVQISALRDAWTRTH